ncbi:hypothetical protein ACIOK4_24955 [Streptomyces bottropensis]|uniref:hypothetical protein n=1 Tax=Streptomyces bottropensis TaxID=42235 RepID=UPI00380C0977
MSTRPESTPSPSVVRLLPFSGPEGKRAHLITDGTPTPLSLLADRMEEQQIETAAVIVILAKPMVEDTASLATAELRWVTRRLESLADVLNICESRGQRIPEYAEPERPAVETDSMD